jgi:hypothetical protein
MKSQDYLIILGHYNQTNTFRNFFGWKFEQRTVILLFDVRRQNNPQINQIIDDDKRVRELIKKIIKILKVENNHPYFYSN